MSLYLCVSLWSEGVCGIERELSESSLRGKRERDKRYNESFDLSGDRFAGNLMNLSQYAPVVGEHQLKKSNKVAKKIIQKPNKNHKISVHQQYRDWKCTCSCGGET